MNPDKPNIQIHQITIIEVFKNKLPNLPVINSQPPNTIMNKQPEMMK